MRTSIVILAVLLAGPAFAENIQKRVLPSSNLLPCYGCGNALKTFHVQPEPEPDTYQRANVANPKASHTGGTND